MLRRQQGQIFTEDVTFGEFMRESRENPYSMTRLQGVLARMEHESIHNASYIYILERFHFSYNTFAKNWSIYRSIEERLKALNCGVVLLAIPDEQILSRSLHRADMVGTDWVDQIVTFFGSHETALAGIVESSRRRREDVSRSVLPWIEIDTSSSDWSASAAATFNFLEALSARGGH